MPPRAVRQGSLVALAVVLSTCAPGPLRLPRGPGESFPGFADAFGEAAAACRGVRTWTAEVSLSGRSGQTRLRGRLIAGLAPDALLLQGVAPFGQPVFILVARGGEATLLLPRDKRVLRHATPPEVVEALAGVRVGPDELRALVSGCVTPGGRPTAGRSYPGGWGVVDLDSGATAFLRQRDGRWRIEAGRVAALSVEYREIRSGLPRRLRLRSTPEEGPEVDLTLEVSQIEVNVPVPDEAFRVTVADDVLPMTIDELREAGPLGARREAGDVRNTGG